MNQLNPLGSTLLTTIGLIGLLWTIPWKVYAVWLAAKRDQKKWFVALLILNTASILEFIYIFYVLKKTWPEVKSDFRHAWGSIRRKS